MVLHYVCALSAVLNNDYLYNLTFERFINKLADNQLSTLCSTVQTGSAVWFYWN